MKHDRTCAAYGNYQPPYLKCTCGAEKQPPPVPKPSWRDVFRKGTTKW